MEWDPRKSRLNRSKHGISFETAQHVFDDPMHLSIQDRYEDGAPRWQTLGIVGNVVLLVAHTYDEDGEGEEVIRIISARKATARERQRYEQAH